MQRYNATSDNISFVIMPSLLTDHLRCCLCQFVQPSSPVITLKGKYITGFNQMTCSFNTLFFDQRSDIFSFIYPTIAVLNQNNLKKITSTGVMMISLITSVQTKIIFKTQAHPSTFTCKIKEVKVKKKSPWLFCLPNF